MNYYTFFDNRFDEMWNQMNNYAETIEEVTNCKMPSNPPSNIWVSEDTNELVMEFALAGHSEDAIKVTANEGTISLVVDPREEKNDYSCVHHGISGKRINFSSKVDSQYEVTKSEVGFKNGLLTIRIPKAESAKAVDLF